MIAEVKHFVGYSQETNRGLPSDDDIASLPLRAHLTITSSVT
jgi:hypothetical protein